jgi:hypothetical protein
MPDPQSLSGNPVSFKLCVGNSGATDWSLEIRSNTSPFPLITGCSWAKVTVATDTFSANASCNSNLSQNGYYRAIVKYWVGSTGNTHVDKTFKRP